MLRGLRLPRLATVVALATLLQAPLAGAELGRYHGVIKKSEFKFLVDGDAMTIEAARLKGLDVDVKLSPHNVGDSGSDLATKCGAERAKVLQDDWSRDGGGWMMMPAHWPRAFGMARTSTCSTTRRPRSCSSTSSSGRSMSC